MHGIWALLEKTLNIALLGVDFPEERARPSASPRSWQRLWRAIRA